jgi:S-adenosylmethionine hydrolase
MIVLMSDFGQSEYAGVMKGVIYSIKPTAKIADLCHDISPQNITEASWILKNNYSYFPPASVFCSVIDPGVGTHRKAIAVKTENYYFVVPDNGQVWETIKDLETEQIRNIPITEQASLTFHGRDVFAKAAAEIDSGRFEQMGPVIDSIEKYTLYLKDCVGIVVRIDSFGNIITNIPHSGKDSYKVHLKSATLKLKFYPNYSAAKDDELFLIEGSNKTLEFSVKNASADKCLRLKVGDRLKIY